MEMFNNNIEFFILCFSALFTLVNPIGLVPIFLSMTENCTSNEKGSIAFRAVIFSTCLLILFALIGELIFSLYGITITAFKIGGGILLCKISLDMLESKRTRTKITPKETKEAEGKTEIAYTPLGIPLIAGPGSIASIMILYAQSININQKSILFVTLILVMILTLLILVISRPIASRLGTTGMRVLQRIMGIFLMAIAVEFILSGIKLFISSQ